MMQTLISMLTQIQIMGEACEYTVYHTDYPSQSLAMHDQSGSI